MKFNHDKDISTTLGLVLDLNLGMDVNQELVAEERLGT
jgi:hypothetical protein